MDAGPRLILEHIDGFVHHVTIPPADETPVAATFREAERPGDFDEPLITFHDLQLVPGGTAYIRGSARSRMGSLRRRGTHLLPTSTDPLVPTSCSPWPTTKPDVPNG